MLREIFGGIRELISGGQTGVDRAALDFAMEHSLQCGGWCPKGRIAEDGPIPTKYPLKETRYSSYPFRTKKNILDSDGTLVLYQKTKDRGTLLTCRLCRVYQKPLYESDLSSTENTMAFREWIQKNDIKKLNIAGPRESFSPGIFAAAKERLGNLLL